MKYDHSADNYIDAIGVSKKKATKIVGLSKEIFLDILKLRSLGQPKSVEMELVEKKLKNLSKEDLLIMIHIMYCFIFDEEEKIYAAKIQPQKKENI